MNAKDVKKPTQEGTPDLHLFLKELSQRRYHLPVKFIKRMRQDTYPNSQPWKDILRTFNVQGKWRSNV